MENILKIKDLKFRYPQRDEYILNIANFEIKRGEKLFLFGPSGSGKTTFLEIVSGVLQAESGELQILNQDLTKMPNQQRDRFRADHLGYIFQSFNLIPYLTVEENISLPLNFSQTKRKKVAVEDQSKRVDELLSRLGIKDLSQEKVTELSVGQQQRVAAARAVLGSPELILADEPTSALDFDHREKFIQLLFEICNRDGITVVFVSHDRTLEKLFDRSLSLLEINNGGVK